jgi:TolB-like protein
LKIVGAFLGEARIAALELSVERSELNVERSGSAPPQAVFLSYSREDLPAARRIADALGAFDVEVWFDQDGLEGGDAWDQKIRRQIKACALFIPIISASTQARREAYFRLEWKLAEERTHLMAAGTSFLLPIAIDDTKEAGALVPESFLRTQWTRLPRGLPNTAFVERVRALLESQLRPHAVPPGPDAASSTKSGNSAKKIVAIAMAAALAIVASVWLWRQRSGGSAPATAATSALSDKSIAVLPFTNLSEDKANGFFADGVQLEIQTSLQNIADLAVIAPTSVMQYRDTKKSDREIGAELGVAYLLKGGVQRAGDTVHVIGQLIDARTQRQVWAHPYNLELKDIFAIQSELARSIAAQLKAVLSPQEKARIGRAPTANTEAYDLYLQARDLLNNGGLDMNGLTHAASLLQSAVKLDDQFAAAWGELAAVHVRFVRRSYDPTGSHLKDARLAAETMERLAPDEPDTWIRLANYYATVVDYVQAEKYGQKVADALPNDSRALVLLGEMAKWNTHLVDVLGYYRKAYELDRQNPEALGRLVDWLIKIRRYDEAAELVRKDPRSDGYTLAKLAFLSGGSTRELDDWFAAHPSDERLNWKFTKGDAAGYIRLADELRSSQTEGHLITIQEAWYAIAYMSLGQTARANELLAANLDRARADKQPDTAAVPMNLVFLGQKLEARAEWEKFQTRRKKQGVDLDFIQDANARAVFLMWLGERDQALDELAHELKTPSGLNVYELRHHLVYQPLQGDPDFKKLLSDPANNAPLF